MLYISQKSSIAMKFLLTTIAFCLFIRAGAQTDIWLDPGYGLDARVHDLIARLTPEEKVYQMMNNTPAIQRLHIPEYNWWNEALHGVARSGIATIFPQPIGMAATFDDSLLHEVAAAISDEARAMYNAAIKKDYHAQFGGLSFWTPNINIFRDPRWGRGQETYGEDPYLTSRMGVALVRGLQGDDPRFLKVRCIADRSGFVIILMRRCRKRTCGKPICPLFMRLSAWE
jgi:beta-glucosidase